MKTKNPIDREYISRTEQTTINPDPLMCKICDREIFETEKFDSVMYLGDTCYYHKSCGQTLVIKAFDDKGGWNKE